MELLPVSDKILNFVQDNNMLASYLVFSLTSTNLTVKVYDKVSTFTASNCQKYNRATDFVVMSFNILI